jgi:hypothetical protein
MTSSLPPARPAAMPLSARQQSEVSTGDNFDTLRSLDFENLECDTYLFDGVTDEV